MAYSPQVSYWRSLNHFRVPPAYIYLWIRSAEFRSQCAQMKGATDMADYVNLKDQRRMRFLLPSAGLLAQFDAWVGPMLDAASTVRSQAEAASTLRDLLLPRLVTGRIDVSELGLYALVGSVA
jgi:type I restriction enzyme S subunit